jgi:nucleoside triphosphate pyrophosphatase
MPLWLASDPLVLASKSEVRRAVLEAAGLPVVPVPADIDERAIEKRARGPKDVAMLLAREKAKAVAARMPGRLVLGADQTLSLGAERFSKPAGRDGARAQLLQLRGKTHELHSGIALVRDAEVLFEDCAVARLSMRNFSEPFLETYLDGAGASVSQSVGGYQLEKTGIHLFEKIEGDHFTILGMPLFSLLPFLRTQKFLVE